MDTHAEQIWNKTEAGFTIARLYHAADYERAELAAKDYFEKTGHPLPDVWLLYARILLARGQIETAVTLLTGATREFPDDYRFWQLIGESQVRQGGQSKALSALQKTVTLNPKNAASYLWLAKASSDSPQRTHWLNTVLLLEPLGSSLAQEAVGLMKDIESKNRVQPSAVPLPRAPTGHTERTP